MKATKKALLLSVISLITCVAMFVGSTFAWFTDSVTSGTNKIVAGNLDIDFVMDKEANGTYVSIANEDGAIFGGENSLTAQNDSTDTLWEPGKTQIVYLGVRNLGTLALQYNIFLWIEDNGLADALEYAIIDGAKASDLSSVTDWSTLKALTTQTANIGAMMGEADSASFTVAKNGVLDEVVNGVSDETDYFALAVHMDENAGNEYMNKDIVIDVTIDATQYTAESDSFDNQYDKGYTVVGHFTDGARDNKINGERSVSCTPFYDSEYDEYYLSFTLSCNSEFNYITIIQTDENGDPIQDVDPFSFNINSTFSYDVVLYLNGIDSNTKSFVVYSNLVGCLAEGTKITMADGSFKNIEDITEGDEVLTFNHEKGIFEGQKVYLAWACEAPEKAFTLHFTNGIDISVVGDHCFFEQESLSYASIFDYNAEDFVGKHFYSVANGRYEELLSVTYGEEPVEYYEIYSEYNANCVAEGMLNVAYDSSEVLNIYSFNEDLSIDKDALERDIAEYGLFEYNENAPYSKELYDTQNWKYVNIMVGKGFGTWDEYRARMTAFLEEYN